ncbi:RNA-directed DNA polymerase, eukaryota, reverse transcriptase zinc-binding domain protein [Tanacetum coccineum]
MFLTTQVAYWQKGHVNITLKWLRSQVQFLLGCKELKLTHLCFADDLLVLCYGNKEYIKIIKDSLDDFSSVSRLKPNLTRGKAKIAWKTLYKPKCQGGLGFKDLGMWNEVLLTKHVWNIAAHKESLWVKWVHMIKLRGRRLWEVNPKFNNSWMWKVILGLRDKAKEHIEFKIWLNEWGSAFLKLISLLIPILNDQQDKTVLRCSSGIIKNFSIKKTWYDYRNNHPDVCWKNLVWFSQCIPSHTFVLWMAILGKLQTQDRIFQWNNDVTMKCSLYNLCIDSHDHLFFQCKYAADVWEIVKDKGYLKGFK